MTDSIESVCGRCGRIIVQDVIPGSRNTWVTATSNNQWCVIVHPGGGVTTTAHYPSLDGCVNLPE